MALGYTPRFPGKGNRTDFASRLGEGGHRSRKDQGSEENVGRVSWNWETLGLVWKISIVLKSMRVILIMTSNNRGYKV